MTYDPNYPPQYAPQPPRRGMSTGQKFAYGCGIPAAFVMLVGVGGCMALSNDSSDGVDSSVGADVTSSAAEPSVNWSAIEREAGIPPAPTGADRRQLLDALKKINPGIVKYEDKAIKAARNQCSSINNGSDRADWTASQRFTYRDVETSEAQGKKINQILKHTLCEK